MYLACGVSEPDARLTAESLVDANLRGVDTHGLHRLLAPYADRLTRGLCDPAGRAAVVHANAATALVASAAR